MKTDKINILCGGPGLGFYIPGLVLQQRLKDNSIPSEVYVYENLLHDHVKDKGADAKVLFHRNFKFALYGQKLAKSVDDSLNANLLGTLFEKWKKEDNPYFVVFSGFWGAIIKLFIEQTPHFNGKFLLCHVDADYSSSWSTFTYTHKTIEHTWFINKEGYNINYKLPVNQTGIIPFRVRKNNLLFHGGGWGIGTYLEKIKYIDAHNYHLDILLYEKDDVLKIETQARLFMISPQWNHWQKNEKGYHHFPPFGQINNNEAITYTYHEAYPDIYDIIREDIAIVSKPGAGTLIDSLSSATPLIILEPFGGYEAKNGEVWKKNRLGISFNDWIRSNFSKIILEECHYSILKKQETTPDFTEYVIDSVNKM